MKPETNIKIVSGIIIIFAIFFFISAYILEGIYNKVGFTVVGLYSLWIVFKPSRPIIDKKM